MNLSEMETGISACKLQSAFLFIFLFLFGASTSLAGEPSPEPILRIETGMHTSQIFRIGLDAANRYLATASADKTLRVWELPAGRLVRTLRPPIDDGFEGRLLGVATSPDGKTIAAGGYTGWDWDRSTYIYLFNRASGKLIRRITGLSNCLPQLAYSRDGRFLVAVLECNDVGKTWGIRIFKTSDGSLAAEDRNYGDTAYGADFDAGGRLVTSSYDGYIRLYDKNFRLMAKKKASGGHQPYMVSFSPDGQRVAVGFEDASKVIVLSGQDLSPLYVPDTRDMDKGCLGVVAWSADGRFLYAAGYVPKWNGREWQNIIRKWSQQGEGRYTDTLVTCIRILHILPLKAGGIIFSTYDPAFGILDERDKLALFRSHVFADFKWTEKNFLVSRDGETIRFLYDYLDPLHKRSPAIFSVRDRQLNPPVSPATALRAPATAVDGLKITDFNTFAPKLNGRVLKLKNNEAAMCTAIAPDHRHFLLGASWTLRLFDRDGRQVWEIPTPEVVWAVNISGDGKTAVAAFGDGTIRWFRMRDGKELISVFLGRDRKTWVMWTPEGYFDASPGGAEMIGYHINRGKDREALFISLNNLYDVFYRPDIVLAKFRGEDISGLITVTAKEALRNPPPTVQFTSFPRATNEAKARVCYRAESAGGGIGEIRLFHNGKLVKSDGHYREAVRLSPGKTQLAAMNSRAIYEGHRGIKLTEKYISPISSTDKGSLFDECSELETMLGENDVSIAAFNRNNTGQSYMESRQFQSGRKQEEPHLYILAVGIDRYRDASVNLKYASKDASDFYRMMAEQSKTVFRADKVHVHILQDEGASKQAVMTKIDEMTRVVQAWDQFVLFVASHGVLIQNQYYIVTSSYSGSLDGASLISSNEIMELSKKIRALNQIYIFDTCHAGGVDSMISGLYDARMSVLAKRMGLHIYASANSLQQAMDGYQGNGLFTSMLLKGLDNNRNTDRNRDKTVSVIELGNYAKYQTSETSRKIGHAQAPLIINFGKDIPVYRLK